MPYIKVEDRDRIFKGDSPKNAGELNFLISLLIDQYWHENGKNYQAFNDILGALDGASKEYYRRKIGYYEDSKMLENGDVYRRETFEITGERTEEAPPEEPRSTRFAGSKVSAASRSKEKARAGTEL
jgi:hypothetical protein